MTTQRLKHDSGNIKASRLKPTNNNKHNDNNNKHGTRLINTITACEDKYTNTHATTNINTVANAIVGYHCATNRLLVNSGIAQNLKQH